MSSGDIIVTLLVLGMVIYFIANGMNWMTKMIDEFEGIMSGAGYFFSAILVIAFAGLLLGVIGTITAVQEVSKGEYRKAEK